ncbi:MAG TPA: PTS sugar transporter subunit IIC [Longimicrobium sp.]|jgi:PTS system mannose-specific IIC component
MGLAEGLVLALLGGVLALDGTSVGQFMVSRPIVACVLAGWIAGDAAAGAMLGMVLEALHVAVLPVGAARYPESAPAAVAAAAVYVAGGGGEGLLLAVILFALAWEWAGSWTVSRLRELNVRVAVPDGTPLEPSAVARRQMAAIAVDFARGVAVTAVGLVLLTYLAGVLPLAGFPRDWGRLAGGIAAAAAVASSIRLFGTQRLAWFAAGAGAGAVFLVAR